MRLNAEQVAIELPQWWYVEWSPLGAYRAVKVEDAHYRNYAAMKDGKPVGYEPLGLFPDLQSALDHVRELKRKRRERRHDEAVVGVGTFESGKADSGAKHPGVCDAAGNGWRDGAGRGEAIGNSRSHVGVGES